MQEQIQYTVYALYDERVPDAVRYIGLSISPARRLKAHLHEAKTSPKSTHKLNWIRKILREGTQPSMRVLAIVDSLDALDQRERQLIAEYRASGHDLTNGTDGGDGAYERTAEMSKTRRELNLVRWSDHSEREKHRAAMRSYWASPDAKEQRSINRDIALRQHADPTYKGGSHTQEACAKISKAKTGRPQPWERTPEWREKVSAAQRGKKRGPWSDKQRAARSAAFANPEARARMSASAKLRGKAGAAERMAIGMGMRLTPMSDVTGYARS